MENVYQRMLYAMVSTIAGISLMKEIVVSYISSMLMVFILIVINLYFVLQVWLEEKKS